MKKLFLTIVLFITSVLESVAIKFPNESELTRCFKSKGFKYVQEIKNIIPQLADQQKDVPDIIFIVENEYASNPTSNDPNCIGLTSLRISVILEILLKDSPEALKEFKELRERKIQIKQIKSK